MCRVLLAFVLLPSRTPPSLEAVAASLAKWEIEADPAAGAQEPDEGPLTFELDPGSLIVAHMPAPIPNGEADAAAELSLGRFGTGPAWQPHETHLTVVLTSGDAPDLDVVTFFTQSVAAVAEAASATGVYWGNGHVAHEASFFVEMADTEMPLMLWSGVSFAQNGDEVSFSTTGLRQFGLPELCIKAPAPMGNEALACLFDFAGYIVGRGRALPDGDTIGRTAAEKLSVSYETSPFGEDERIAVLALPARKEAPKGKPN